MTRVIVDGEYPGEADDEEEDLPLDESARNRRNQRNRRKSHISGQDEEDRYEVEVNPAKRNKQ